MCNLLGRRAFCTTLRIPATVRNLTPIRMPCRDPWRGGEDPSQTARCGLWPLGSSQGSTAILGVLIGEFGYIAGLEAPFDSCASRLVQTTLSSSPTEAPVKLRMEAISCTLSAKTAPFSALR
ncbi:hypothetical protein, variant [Blastomyces dermatitidis ATCC 18188]|uniref:Uncharacterized protein n=1 Tax=Ajellomyces dermatitidis (strain ATCC 18188 / CBS 674.68) TaxID=653446 RepID=F2TBN8_AJEDA|nr:hypothetical protein BDDG_03566 [Blastomyces dermatitidis ATCC 18188]KMW67339.1 hypothetical protein, variant [Blastomyces dermatitidis ATCC 18188]